MGEAPPINGGAMSSAVRFDRLEGAMVRIEITVNETQIAVARLEGADKARIALAAEIKQDSSILWVKWGVVVALAAVVVTGGLKLVGIG